jgi:hypothetical protein
MALTITDFGMSSDQTPHTARLLRFEAGDAWRVSWLPKRLMDRNAAITAMTLAEHIDHNGLWDYRLSGHIDAWAAELGLTGPQAIEQVSRSRYPDRQRRRNPVASETPDRLTARLDQIRRRQAMNNHSDCAALLGAVEAVLKLLHQPGPVVVLGALCKDHRELRHFSITGTEADRLRDCPDCSATVTLSCSCGHHDFERCAHRVVITAKLLGKEGSDA